MATSPRLKKCRNCKHHVSIHAYSPEKPLSGPQACGVLGCKCMAFVRPYMGGSDGMSAYLLGKEAERAK